MPTGKQTPWTDAEDAKLQALVKKHGTKKWAAISSELRTKASKQCRRRWQNHLSIEKNTSGWSPEEDRLLMEAHKRMGNRWTDIAKLCNGRTDNAVKNRYMALVKKQRRGSAGAGGGGSGAGALARKNKRRPGPGPGAGLGMGGSPSKRVCLKPGLSIEIPSGPFTRAGAPTPSNLNPITVRVPREGLTPQELRMVNEVNALNSPLTFQIEEWPAVPPMTTRSRLANATPSNFQDVQDVVSWIFGPPPGAGTGGSGGGPAMGDGAGAAAAVGRGAGRGGRTPRFGASGGGGLSGRRGRPEPLSLLDVGFGSSEIPDSARVATRHLLQKHLLTPMATGDTPWMPDSPLGGLGGAHKGSLSPRFTPNEIQMLLHTLEGGSSVPGATPGSGRHSQHQRSLLGRGTAKSPASGTTPRRSARR